MDPLNCLGQKLVTKENRRRHESPIPLVGWWFFCSTKIPWKVGGARMRTWVGAAGGGGHSFLSQYCRPPGQAKGASFLCPRMWNRTNSPNASFFYTFRRKFISRHIGITLWWSSASTRALSCVGLCLRKDRVGVWETWPQTGWQIGPTAAAKGKEATKQVPTKEQLSTSWWCIRRPNRVPAGRRILYPWVSRKIHSYI